MITLITGLPGAGKTLYALNYAKNLSEKENRPVYYSGIADLKLPWLELDNGEEWHQVAPGSIVVIDECQRVFRPRGNGAVVPVHVSKLETHRHDGIDLIVITQHPMLADSNLRRLVGRHFHVVRAFGTKKATVHEWQEVKTECDKSRTGSIRHDFFYPKDAFDWYKSAEVHTHKARIPMRVYFIFVLPFLLAGIVYYAYSTFRTPGSSITKIADNKSVQVSQSLQASGFKTKSTKQFLDERVPRVHGLAYTAPVFDEVTKPTDAPFPAACLASKEKCSCFSQQATVLDVTDSICRQIVARGYFREWKDTQPTIQTSQRVAPSIERSQVKPGEAIDRYSTIPPPPPLRVSPGFNSTDTPKDNRTLNEPTVARPGGLPGAPGVPGG